MAAMMMMIAVLMPDVHHHNYDGMMLLFAALASLAARFAASLASFNFVAAFLRIHHSGWNLTSSGVRLSTTWSAASTNAANARLAPSR